MSQIRIPKGMTSETYLQTPEGQRAKQAFDRNEAWLAGGWQQPGNPMGSAQPRQPQSQGTPYGDYAPGTSREYMARNPDTGPFGGQSPKYSSGYPAQKPDARPQLGVPMSFGAKPSDPANFSKPAGGSGNVRVNNFYGNQGNYAYAPPDQRPAPFTQSMNFMGQPMDPGQFYGQRDAFIQNINQARQPFAMNPGGGRPQMDFGGMWNQAGNMVASGWQNPLTGLMGHPQRAMGDIDPTYQGPQRQYPRGPNGGAMVNGREAWF